MVERADLQPSQANSLSEPLDYVLSLAEAALTEMRALIFELRPESLEVEGLVAALQRQADALQARHGIAVTARLDAEPSLPLPANLRGNLLGGRARRHKNGDPPLPPLRVAQEALHNVVKHAAAQKVHISLQEKDGVVRLCVRDDGRGFDASQNFPGHLGLRSMAERVAATGGTLEIESESNQGTQIQVEINTQKLTKEHSIRTRT